MNLTGSRRYYRVAIGCEYLWGPHQQLGQPQIDKNLYSLHWNHYSISKSRFYECHRKKADRHEGKYSRRKVDVEWRKNSGKPLRKVVCHEGFYFSLCQRKYLIRRLFYKYIVHFICRSCKNLVTHEFEYSVRYIHDHLLHVCSLSSLDMPSSTYAGCTQTTSIIGAGKKLVLLISTEMSNEKKSLVTKNAFTLAELSGRCYRSSMIWRDIPAVNGAG